MTTAIKGLEKAVENCGDNKTRNKYGNLLQNPKLNTNMVLLSPKWEKLGRPNLQTNGFGSM